MWRWWQSRARAESPKRAALSPGRNIHWESEVAQEFLADARSIGVADPVVLPEDLCKKAHRSDERFDKDERQGRVSQTVRAYVPSNVIAALRSLLSIRYSWSPPC